MEFDGAGHFGLPDCENDGRLWNWRGERYSRDEAKNDIIALWSDASASPSTPAPGYAGHNGAQEWRAELCDDGTWMVCTVGDVIASGLTEPLARLIAAAPVMYRALRQIGLRYGPTRNVEECAALARAAIAKAAP